MSDATTLDDGDVLVVVGRSWGWAMFFGVVSLVIGIIVALHPKHSVFVVAVLLAIWLIFAGIFRIVVAIADRVDSGGTRWFMAAIGIVSIVLGIVILHHTSKSVALVGFIVGLFWLLAGLADFFAGYTSKGAPGRGLMIFAGLVGVVLGTIALLNPGFSLTVIALLFGIWLAVFGVLGIVNAFQLRKLQHETK